MFQYVIPLIHSMRPLWAYVLNFVLALAILATLLSVISYICKGGLR